jgi:hypothetical protein
MSDRDDAPDPIDQAYVRAEAALGDDDARAARRARVLAAVAREPAAPAASSPSRGRLARRHGGWLAAAGVVGLSAFLATRLYQPAPRLQPAPAPAAALGPKLPPPGIAAPPPAVPPQPQASARVAVAMAPRAATPPPPPPHPELFPKAPAPSPLNISPVERPRAPAPAPPPPPAVVEGDRIAEAPAAKDAGRLPGGARDEPADAQSLAAPTARRASVRALTAPPAAASPGASEPSARPPSDDPARLRAAAAAGRTAELEALLARGGAVDAPDADGETALMKSIQADHAAAAALLRRHGASLDRRNHAGVSARDMAAAIGDAELNQAVGLGP